MIHLKIKKKNLFTDDFENLKKELEKFNINLDINIYYTLMAISTTAIAISCYKKDNIYYIINLTDFSILSTTDCNHIMFKKKHSYYDKLSLIVERIYLLQQKFEEIKE
jgi:hypothetical protein